MYAYNQWVEVVTMQWHQRIIHACYDYNFITGGTVKWLYYIFCHRLIDAVWWGITGQEHLTEA